MVANRGTADASAIASRGAADAATADFLRQQRLRLYPAYLDNARRLSDIYQQAPYNGPRRAVPREISDLQAVMAGQQEDLALIASKKVLTSLDHLWYKSIFAENDLNLVRGRGDYDQTPADLKLPRNQFTDAVAQMADRMREDLGADRL